MTTIGSSHPISTPPRQSSLSPKKGSPFLHYGVIGSAAAGSIMFPLAVAALIAPKFREIFTEFGTQLAFPSLAWLWIGETIGTAEGFTLFLLFGIAIAATVGFWWRLRRRVGVSLLMLCIGMGLLLIPLFVIFMMLPLTRMIQQLQDGNVI